MVDLAELLEMNAVLASTPEGTTGPHDVPVRRARGRCARGDRSDRVRLVVARGSVGRRRPARRAELALAVAGGPHRRVVGIEAGIETPVVLLVFTPEHE